MDWKILIIVILALGAFFVTRQCTEEDRPDYDQQRQKEHAERQAELAEHKRITEEKTRQQAVESAKQDRGTRPKEQTAVLENEDFRITSWAVKHFVPTIGLRIESKKTGKILAYSSDTEPHPILESLAADADILLHEAAGAPPGHSTARQAGELASKVNAKALYLIHYQVWDTDPSPLVPEAQSAYDGPITLCKDFDEFEF